ncbi:MAG: imidazole glycerol phosphate synthase subunit HisF [Hadesarchaea archaeon]|nr:imidazole glycerol phosphate synthase subunit HisF [Hadesarchaea archaeon]
MRPYHRIIPCLDTRAGVLVKGVCFRDVRDVGDPAEFAKCYEEDGADEIVLLDITATPENKPTLLDVVRKVASVISIPLAVGGGIRNVEDAGAVLDAGASKISVNTAAVKRPELLRELSEKFGKQRVVSAIDGKIVTKGKWEVCVSGGMKPTGIDMVEWAKRVEELGAGEILYTGVHTDGTQKGYDVEGTRAIAEAVGIPVIASGGAGKLEDIYEVLTAGRADAALAASIFHFGTYTVGQVKDYLRERGVEVR